MTTLSSLYFILFPFLFRGSKKREKRFELPPLKSYYNTYTSYVSNIRLSNSILTPSISLTQKQSWKTQNSTNSIPL